MKYPLITVSYNEKARQEVFDQLTGLIGDKFAVSSYCYDDFIRLHPEPTGFVLITAAVIKDIVIRHLGAQQKYLVAKRTINPKNLGQLFRIPAHAEVLVVNNLYENALEVIKELETIGIQHVKFTPFNASDPPRKSFKYAITPGETHLVPPEVLHVIDIGTRLISLMTIAEVYYYFSGNALSDELLYSRYIKDLVSITMKLSQQVRQNEILQQQMNMVITNFEDGVLVTDAADEITFHNEMAAKILLKENLLGQKLDEVLVDRQIPSEYSDTAFSHIGNKVVHVTTKEVELAENHTTKMVTLKDLTSIAKIDQQYKRHQKFIEHNAKYTFFDIVHKSGAMAGIIEKAKLFARTDATVLITGESGVGKELLAQSLHNASFRAEYPFVAINCAALSEGLLESELFGYEEGAFTGARKSGKKGLFEIADHGTIFLDEIGDAPLAIQKKLLRVLQEKEILRVAGDKTIAVDVRVIAATNKDLRRLVESGDFRSDLYYRLNVLPLSMPSLRERRDDIEILLQYLIKKHGYRENISFDRSTTEMLKNYSWPGNIRELENVAEYITTIAGVSNNLPAELSQLLTGMCRLDSLGRGERDIGKPQPIFLRKAAIRDELLAILQQFDQYRERQIFLGRYKLREVLRDAGLQLTDQQIKNRLNLLKKAQLILSSNGRGSMITDKGVEYLQANRSM